ncbi:MAG TPA: hypothetical protein VIC71_04045 [Gammaproteobacteria bacterium]|jgi:hypothetical protein
MSLMVRLEEWLSPSALLGALASAVILKISVVALETGFPFAYLTIAIVVWATANYLIEIIEQRAIGEGWAVFSLDTVATLRSQLGVVLLLELTAVVAVFKLLETVAGLELAWAFAAAATAVAPASVALLAVTRDPLRSLHPLNLLRAVIGVGLPYIGLALACVAVVVLVALAFRRLGFVEFLVASYAAFWLAYSIGFVVYAKRVVLGVHAPKSPEAKLARELERLQRIRTRALDHAYGVASRGNLESAFAYINQYVASESDPLAARQWMYFEMTRWASVRPARAFGEQLARDLEAAGQPEAAAKVRLSCAHLDAQSK